MIVRCSNVFAKQEALRGASFFIADSVYNTDNLK